MAINASHRGRYRTDTCGYASNAATDNPLLTIIWEAWGWDFKKYPFLDRYSPPTLSYFLPEAERFKVNCVEQPTENI